MKIPSHSEYNAKKNYPGELKDTYKPESARPEHPFHFRIHPTVRRVLDRIGVPEPGDFVADPFQIEALDGLEHSDVLVTAPTGAGKTYIAIKAIESVFERGGRSWYASPLKALSNAKYEELSQIFGDENVGILTGDRKENIHAPVIVGTTEILRNQLYDTMHQGIDLPVDLVVLDEAHYLGDQDRGVVWEEVLIYLPARVRLLLLSATIDNAREICEWLEWLRHSPCQWVSSDQRPVPLYPLFLLLSGELIPLSTKRGLFSKVKAVDSSSFSRKDFPNVPKLLDVLRDANLLPAIFFMKSRADCEKAITLCGPSNGRKRRKDSKAFSSRLKEILDTYPFLRNHQHLSILKKARVGAHHGGQLPHWKLLLEKLMQEGFLDAIFSTSTVAAGVNFPARTVVISQSDRFNGKEFAPLSATDLLQMTGRAGRRGMDEIGFVLAIPGPFQDPQLIHDLLRSAPDPIASQIKINASMVLNLLLSHKPDEIRNLFASSLATFQNLSKEVEIRKEYESLQKELDQWVPEMACGTIDRLAEVRPQYGNLKEQIRKARKLWKRQANLRSLYSHLTVGRIFLSKRGTPYVVLEEPDLERQTVVAVRLGFPLRFRRGQIRPMRVGFHRIREFGGKVDSMPSFLEREAWKDLALETERKLYGSNGKRHIRTDAPADGALPEGEEDGTKLASDSNELGAQEALGEYPTWEALRSTPCNRCRLFGPCQKSRSHPFSNLLKDYFEHRSKMESIQQRLWQDFLKHYHLLQEEGYVDKEGNLSEDGLWASKLRLDQPLLISEGIRKGVLPLDSPELLAALIAPFVMDRDRPGDHQLASMVWKFQDLAKPFFRMLQGLQRLKEHLNAAGFSTPPLPFWTVVTLYYWAAGSDWDTVREISGMDEGDLAMVILRTADHLRQIESLSETHPQLATSARKAIEMILREPVLVR